MKAKVVRLATAALVFAASVPAHAQFMSNYPVIVVPPPPAQNLIAPKPAPKPAQPSKANPQPPDTPPPNLGNCYQGRTKVC